VKLVLAVIRLMLGAILLWSGLLKARQPFEFLGTVYSYQLVAARTGLLIAAWVPWLEIVLGGCLISGILIEGALLAATCLTGSFLWAIFSAWHRSLGINCGCFGTSQATIDGYTVLRSVGLLSLSMIGLATALRLRRVYVSGSIRQRPRRLGLSAIRHFFVPARGTRPSVQAVRRHSFAVFASSLFRSLSHRARLGGGR
jgi:uncharacterized membrane protein YphA (DoxX/SURF4 family)